MFVAAITDLKKKFGSNKGEKIWKILKASGVIRTYQNNLNKHRSTKERENVIGVRRKTT